MQPPAGMGPPPGMPGAPGSGETSDGSYSSGDVEATTTDDGTYLRGAQVTNADGIVFFDTIYPGWYRGRTVHIHLKVHIDRSTVLTTQLYFDDALTDEIFSTVEPYTEHSGRDTRNDTDSIHDPTGTTVTARQATGSSPRSTWVSTSDHPARRAAVTAAAPSLGNRPSEIVVKVLPMRLVTNATDNPVSGSANAPEPPKP